MTKLIKILLIIIALIAAMFLGIRASTHEDNWICQKGNWIKHGNPSSPVPDTACQN